LHLQRVLLATLVSVVVALSEVILLVIWQSRRWDKMEKRETGRNLRDVSAKRKKDDGDGKNDEREDSEIKKELGQPEGLRQRMVTSSKG
jgi:hypothetical protein